MNLQAHMAGQISGQAGTSVPGIPQQNGNPISAHLQNSGGHRNTLSMEPDIETARRIIKTKM